MNRPFFDPMLFRIFNAAIPASNLAQDKHGIYIELFAYEESSSTGNGQFLLTVS
jgi:hypothetical protein